jgi:hypothetical protein
VEVKTTLLPLVVVGHRGTRQLQLLARVPQREREATGANCSMRPLLAHGESVELTTEEMDPQVLVRRDP